VPNDPRYDHQEDADMLRFGIDTRLSSNLPGGMTSTSSNNISQNVKSSTSTSKSNTKPHFKNLHPRQRDEDEDTI